MISVGEENPYGHPSAQTMATLAAEGVEVIRTDEEGEVSIEVARERWWMSG